MAYNTYELISFILDEINFNRFSIKENENEIEIEIDESDEINKIDEFLSDEFSSNPDAYEILSENASRFIIKFNINIIDASDIKENELIDECISNIEYYENLMKL